MDRDEVVQVVHEAIGKGTRNDALAELIADIAVEVGIANPGKEDEVGIANPAKEDKTKPAKK